MKTEVNHQHQEQRLCGSSPSHSSSPVSGSVPVSLPDGVSRASRLMSREGVSDRAAAEKPSVLGSRESLRFRVRLRDGATRRFLAPPTAASDRARVVGGAGHWGRGKKGREGQV